MIAALLLAAGRGSRFGGEKLTALLGDRPLVRWSAEALQDAVATTIVVTAPGAAGIRGALSGVDVRFVEHAGHDKGMGSSIRSGISALPPDVEAVIIALADQPLISRDVVVSLCERWRLTRAPAVAPQYRDGRGHPVLFDRACFPALAALKGDRGARAVLDALGTAALMLNVDTPMPLDVDTRDALRDVAALLRPD